jgi:hypothetical protein
VRTFPATIRGGVAVGDGLSQLPDGAQVEVVAIEEDELTPEEHAELDEAEASLDRGEGIPWEEVKRMLQERRAARTP